MPVKIKGGAEIVAKLKLYKERARAAASAALYQRALQIMAASDSLVPVKTGRLRASHYVELPGADGRLKMGYGTDYALPVHERLDYRHKHGQAKFLELAMDEARPGNADWLRRKTIENIKKGIGLEAKGAMPADRQSSRVNADHHEALRLNRKFRKGEP